MVQAGIACGHNTAPANATATAAPVRQADIDLDFFRIDRFARGTLARGQYAYGILG